MLSHAIPSLNDFSQKHSRKAVGRRWRSRPDEAFPLIPERLKIGKKSFVKRAAVPLVLMHTGTPERLQKYRERRQSSRNILPDTWDWTTAPPVQQRPHKTFVPDPNSDLKELRTFPSLESISGLLSVGVERPNINFFYYRKNRLC